MFIWIIKACAIWIGVECVIDASPLAILFTTWRHANGLWWSLISMVSCANKVIIWETLCKAFAPVIKRNYVEMHVWCATSMALLVIIVIIHCLSSPLSVLHPPSSVRRSMLYRRQYHLLYPVALETFTFVLCLFKNFTLVSKNMRQFITSS